jgi:hypothetical protein
VTVAFGKKLACPQEGRRQAWHEASTRREEAWMRQFGCVWFQG